VTMAGIAAVTTVFVSLLPGRPRAAQATVAAAPAEAG